jgi:hypothetical protein
VQGINAVPAGRQASASSRDLPSLERQAPAIAPFMGAHPFQVTGGPAWKTERSPMPDHVRACDVHEPRSPGSASTFLLAAAILIRLQHVSGNPLPELPICLGNQVTSAGSHEEQVNRS